MGFSQREVFFEKPYRVYHYVLVKTPENPYF
jgi:hypothetical protein